MYFHFKRLGSQVLTYGLGDTISRIVSFLALPIFTRFLSPKDYGIASLLTVANALIVCLSDFGLISSIFRFYREEDEAKKRQMITTVQMAMFFSTLLVAILAVIFAKEISSLFFKTPDYAYIVRLNFLTIPLSKLIAAPMASFRVQEKARTFAILSVLSAITLIGINLFMVGFLKRGVNGLFEGPFIQAAVFALGIGAYSLIKFGFSFDPTLFRKMAHFGVPLILNSVSMWIINFADRFILSRILNLSEVGLYTVGYSIGMAIALPVGAFITAWPAFYMSLAKEKNAPKIYSEIMTFYSLGIGFFVLCVAVFSRDYFYFFTAPDYRTAYIVSPLIALAYAIRGNFSIAAASAYIKRKTSLVTVSELISMAVNVVLVFVLSYLLGRIGAAWATLVSYGLLPVAMYLLSKKMYPISYDYRRILQIFIVGLSIYFAAKAIYEPTLINLLVRTLLVILYPLVFFCIGFFKEGEIRRLKEIKAKIFKKR